MQATMTQNPPRAKRQKTSFKGIGRAVKYLTHYKSQALLPYIFLVIATLSQLAVPRMIRNVIDAVTSGFLADQVLQALDQIPVVAHGHSPVTVAPQKRGACIYRPSVVPGGSPLN